MPLNETILVRCNDCTLPDVQSKTANKIAAENDISPRSVYYAEDFVDGVDAAEEVLSGVSKDILSGKIKPKQSDMEVSSKAPAGERKQIAKPL